MDARGSSAGIHPGLQRVVDHLVALSHGRDPAEEMARQLRTLRVIDKDGAVLVGSLSHVDFLADVDLEAWIRRIATNISANPHLANFAEAASGRSFDFGEPRVVDACLWSALCYSVVLDRVSRALGERWEQGLAMHRRWERELASIDFAEHLTSFERAKWRGIDAALETWISNCRTGRVPATQGRLTLPIQVAIVCFEDLRHDNRANARAGLALVLNPPGSPVLDPATGAGPSSLSPDGRWTTRRPPHPRAWADLYWAWNLAFISHYYPDFPSFYATLLVPLVSDPSQTPESFLCRRLMALYTHVRFELFSRAERRALGHPSPPSMVSPDFVRLFGQTNARGARQYVDHVAHTESTTWRQLQQRLV